MFTCSEPSGIAVMPYNATNSGRGIGFLIGIGSITRQLGLANPDSGSVKTDATSVALGVNTSAEGSTFRKPTTGVTCVPVTAKQNAAAFKKIQATAYQSKLARTCYDIMIVAQHTDTACVNTKLLHSFTDSSISSALAIVSMAARE